MVVVLRQGRARHQVVDKKVKKLEERYRSNSMEVRHLKALRMERWDSRIACTSIYPLCRARLTNCTATKLISKK